MVYVKINYEARKASEILLVLISAVFSALLFHPRQDFFGNLYRYSYLEQFDRTTK